MINSLFEKFLNDTVNLNKSRYDIARKSPDIIRDFLNNDDLFSDKFIDLIPQGSFRQRTIIKPVGKNDFDVDLLLEMRQVDGWDPKDYLFNLAERFRNSGIYKDKIDTRGKSRCVTIDYEIDFHVDVVPAISRDGGYWIMNKKTNTFESTDGDGYAHWFESKNDIVGNDNLIKIVKLFKFLRDSSQDFEIKSILLTTLIGMHVYESDRGGMNFSDIPTSFLTLIKRLESYLQQNVNMPEVKNPILSTENFNRHWNNEKYQIFRKKIHEYCQKSIDASSTNDPFISAEKWQSIFGENFPVPQNEQIVRVPGEQFLSDLGISEALKYKIRIDCRVLQKGYRPFFLRDSNTPLRKKRKLEFFIKSSNIPEEFHIMWKVKNTGDEAGDARDLRGDIIDDLGFRTKIENTKYTGAHYIECYAIQDGVCVAKDRIDVPIANLF